MRYRDQSASDGRSGGDAGAYGLRVRGLKGADLQDATDETLIIGLRLEPQGRQETAIRFDDRTLVLPAGRACTVVDRDAREAVLYSDRRVPSAQLAHPFLSVPGIAFAYWRGADPMHAGAFAMGGGTILVLAAKGGGKSTTMAGLAEAGTVVVADDLAVVERGQVLAGPRLVDLRPSAARAAGLWERTRSVRGRRRLSLPPIGDPLPLRAVVVLAWGSEIRMQSVPLAERLATAIGHRFLTGLGPGTGRVQMDLLAVPWWRLERPRSPDVIPATIDRIQVTFS